SQHKNYERAMRILRSRVLEMMRKKAHEERAAARKEQIGSGDRSERPIQRWWERRYQYTRLHSLRF
ncbi:MAG: hypothetical protein EB101_10290, partial [Chitinophagia bacterium]|nr:hypothetical protein [Chitinophagia bacterium]